MGKKREAPPSRLPSLVLSLARRGKGRALSWQIQQKDKSAGSHPRHHCTSKSCIVACGPKTQPSYGQAAGKPGVLGEGQGILVGEMWWSAGPRETAASPGSRLCLPLPSLPLQWPGPGPRVWKPLVSHQFPSGCRVTAGDRATIKDSLQEMQVRCPSSIQPVTPAKLCQAQGHSKGPCSQAVSGLFSVCKRDRQKSNGKLECGQCQEGKTTE